MTSVEDIDLSKHVLDVCKHQPRACRLALTDLLIQTVNEADDMSDQQIWNLMQSHLKLAPSAKVHKVYLRCVATMAKLLKCVAYCTDLRYVCTRLQPLRVPPNFFDSTKINVGLTFALN